MISALAISVTDSQAIDLLDQWRASGIRTRALVVSPGLLVLLVAGRWLPAVEYPCRVVRSSRLANQTPEETQLSILRQSARQKGIE